MWYRKLIAVVLLLLFSLISVNALTPDNSAYWKLDNNNLSDATTNGFDLSNTGTTNISGIINDARNFDGSTQNLQHTTADYNLNNTNTVNFWINLDTMPVTAMPIMIGNSNTVDFLKIFYTSAGAINFAYKDTTNQDIKTTATGVLTTGSWQMYTVTKDGTGLGNFKIYKNSVELTPASSSGGSANLNSNEPIYIGSRVPVGDFFIDGKMDEIGLWGRALNLSEIQELYNNGTGLQYPYTPIPPSVPTLTIDDISLINGTTTNQSSLNIALNITNTSTNNLINTTLFLSNGSSYDIGTNTQNVSYTLNNISEGTYNIWTYSFNNETNVTSQNFTYTFDFFAPNLSVSNFTEWNNGYNVTNLNTTLNITCTDPNIAHCHVHWDDNTSTDLFTTQYKLFTTNGNHTFTLHAFDTANNTHSVNGTIFINPYQYFKFNDNVLSILVEDFTFGGIASINNSVSILTYNSILSLGSNTLQFEKFGYNSENFTININLTSELNETFNISPVALAIQVFDSQSITNQLTFNITIQNDSESQVFTNQFNFSKRFNETLSGAIVLTIESVGYSQGFFFNTLNPDTSLNIQAYLTQTNQSDTIRFFVADSAQASVGLVGSLIELQKLINGSYVTIQQGLTGGNGESFIQTDASQSYLLIFSKDGYVSATAQSIPGVLDYSVTLSSTSVVFTYIDDISFSFTPTETVLGSNQTLNFTGFMSGTGFSFIQFNVYNSSGGLLYQENSTNPTGTTFSTPIFLSNTTTEIITEMVYIIDTVTKTVSKTYEILTIGGFVKVAQDYSEDSTFSAKFIRFLVIMIVVIGGLSVSRTDEMQEISLFVIPIYVFLSYISFIAWTQAAALSVLAIVFYIGGKK